MNSGPELDALIDAKIFGHPLCKENHAQSCGWCMSCNPPIWEELSGVKCGRPTPNVRAYGFWPPYSTEMKSWDGGAWEVVKQFNEVGFRGQVWVVHTICRISCNTHPFYHQCIINNGITSPSDRAISYEGWSKEGMPHAICLAALACLEDKRSPTYRFVEVDEFRVQGGHGQYRP